MSPLVTYQLKDSIATITMDDGKVNAMSVRIGAIEVAIGLTMPFFGIEICRQRLAPAHFNRAVINAKSMRLLKRWPPVSWIGLCPPRIYRKRRIEPPRPSPG